MPPPLRNDLLYSLPRNPKPQWLRQPGPELKSGTKTNQVAGKGSSCLTRKGGYFPSSAVMRLMKYRMARWAGGTPGSFCSQTWCVLTPGLCSRLVALTTCATASSDLPSGKDELPGKPPSTCTPGTSLQAQPCLLLHHGRFFGFQDMVC